MDKRSWPAREHVIADLGVNHVERYVLRSGYSSERVQHDYGIDLLMFTYTKDGEIENGHVQLQLKATDKPRILQDRQTIAISIAYADVKHWMFEPMPVILVVYDAVADRACWVYVQRQLEDSDQSRLLADDEQESVTFHIPVSNRLDCGAIEEFRKYRDAVLECVNRKGRIAHNG